MNNIRDIRVAALKNRLLLYKQRHNGVLGKLGFVQEFYVQVPATILVELPPDPRRMQVNTDITDFYRLGALGGILEVQHGAPASPDATDAESIAVFTDYSGRTLAHEAMPVLERGGHVQFVLNPASVSTHELVQLFVRMVSDLERHGGGLRHPLLIVLMGFDALVANHVLYRDVLEAITRVKLQRHSVVLNIDPAAVAAAATPEQVAEELRRAASLFFVGEERSQWIPLQVHPEPRSKVASGLPHGAHPAARITVVER